MSEELVERSERILFALMAVLGGIIWLGIILASFGIGLFFLLGIFIAYVAIHSWFISYIRGTGAIVTEEQYPDLYKLHMECCEKLGIKTFPTLFVIHADGIFNALATRFLNKHYVILFSDIVDALEDESEALKFYIGHELGHVKRNHLLWAPLLAPVSWLPLIGAGYSRACEITCDNHGRYCCDNVNSAVKAMAALAVGAHLWKSFNLEAYLKQLNLTKGFWMSFHEVVGDYPWLVRRIAKLKKDDPSVKIPARNPFAWVFAVFVPRLTIVSLLLIYFLFILGLGLLKGQELIQNAQDSIEMENQGLLSYPLENGTIYEDQDGNLVDEDGNILVFPSE